MPQSTIIQKISTPRYLQLYTIMFKVLVVFLPFCQELCSAVLADKDLASPEKAQTFSNSVQLYVIVRTKLMLQLQIKDQVRGSKTTTEFLDQGILVL